MDADNAIEYTDPTYYDFFIQSSTEIVNFWNKLEPERTASLWRHYTIHPLTARWPGTLIIMK